MRIFLFVSVLAVLSQPSEAFTWKKCDTTLHGINLSMNAETAISVLESQGFVAKHALRRNGTKANQVDAIREATGSLKMDLKTGKRVAVGDLMTVRVSYRPRGSIISSITTKTIDTSVQSWRDGPFDREIQDRVSQFCKEDGQLDRGIICGIMPRKVDVSSRNGACYYLLEGYLNGFTETITKAR